MRFIEDIIKYSVISSRAGKVIAEDGYSTRLQLNVLIVSPFGSGKSTLFYYLEKAELGYVLNDYSLAGLVGTIKPNGLIIHGFVTKCAGSVMMIDEFQKFEKPSRDALLNIMESHKFTRTLGYLVSTQVKDYGKYYEVIAEKNFLTVKAKLSYIIGSMYFKIKTIDDLALLSRCFPISLLTDEYQGFDLYLGKSIFTAPKELHSLRDILDGKDIFIKDEQRNYLVDRTKKLFLKYRIEQGFITRALWDLTRIAGINAILEDREVISNEDMDIAMSYIPLQIIGYSRSTLTPTQLRVLDVIHSSRDGITARQIAKILKMQESNVSNALKIIEHTGLVKSYKIGNTIVYIPVVYGDISDRDAGEPV